MQQFPEGLVALLLHQSHLLTDKQLRILLQSVDHIEQVFTLTNEQIQSLELEPPIKEVLTALQRQLGDLYNEDGELDAQWRYCLNHQIGILPISSDSYPDLLKQIYDPPPVLYYRGNIGLLHRPQLAIVGSRRPTQSGAKNAYQFAKAFAEAGFTVTSGMALGIDSHAHSGALAAGGDTIAVLGTGIDVVYPWRNRNIYQEIINKGLLLSELPLGSQALKGHFPRRNRIVSGLSLGVLVVEAAIESGSLISARCAVEQDREVFAIPGSIHSPTSRGCHTLIRQGATLVETVEHVLEEFSGWLPEQEPRGVQLTLIEDKPHLDPSLQSLLQAIGYDPQPIALLQQQLKMALPELMAGLVQLEIKGLVENRAGHYQRIS